LPIEVFPLPYFCTRNQQKVKLKMEIITIESGIWQQLISRIGKIERFVVEATQPITIKDEDLWVDNSQAQRLLCVENRTLQQYRSDGKLAYKRFGRQVRYRLSDIEDFAGITLRPLSQKNLRAIRKECIERNKQIMSHQEV
jgi:hypothetical protein